MRFLILNKVINKIPDIDSDGFIEKMGHLAESIEWAKAEYARDLSWIKEDKKFEDVETPTDEVSFEEFQTEDGQKKEWNRYLTKLISEYENGDLFNKILDGYFNCVLIVPQECGDRYFNVDERILPFLDYTDVTDEYSQIINAKIDKSEIENYVKNHTQDEVKRKYHVFGYMEEFWVW